MHQGGLPLIDVLHPRPNPIIAAMYTMRDLEADIVLMHGPAGCGFMAARRLEEAGVRVMTTGMNEDDLIFGANDKLARILKSVDERYRPKLIGVVGTCASMIIGEDLDAAVKKAGVRATVLPVDVHGCSGPNTAGAIRTLEVAAEKRVISYEERDRQKSMLTKATLLEKERGLTSREYLEPHPGSTKLSAGLRIVNTLREGGKVAVALNAKKETAYGFADVMRAVEYARSKVGGTATYIGNLDPEVGLPRIRRYSSDILRDLDEAGVAVDVITGGLDEYPVTGDKAAAALDASAADLRVIAGLPHAVPGLRKDDVLVTDQPRELRNYIDQGYHMSVGEITTHADVMGTSKVLYNELGNTIREITDKGWT
ncbi:Ni-sirohydrochlorin a,c-diamide reductive cyclase catalytic subunit [Methanomassiliicoccus luminyensis]|uniref:Ni-sirohydrochlorin a,c-diamide reductive cyclase catalytic subunit n=1 Tax=Methanomassiliicoccus luminyensis TaxID=1080712 RepID=UPI0009D9B054|nr:Ni-sirohydrochlorin a,c-diamide reductive cyclase catalytic subunit [Methanomassiliicoccus luminyensis]